MQILVTGGVGYIGIHTCIKLIQNGHEVIVVDNLVNSKYEAVSRLRELTGQNVKFYKIDICDELALANIFKENNIECVIHFAAFKSIQQSCRQPLLYYNNNVKGFLILLSVMQRFQVYNLVFSSSATVYGKVSSVPIKENAPLMALSPYGETKLIGEKILNDLYNAERNFNFVILRYFNPIGAHESGRVGEDPIGIPNNLMPYVCQVASGKLDKLMIFGNDYPTHDGTGVRDFVHVSDLAAGHVAALSIFHKSRHATLPIYNLGTGTGYSVLDVVNTFIDVNKVNIPYVVTMRRNGDVPICYADPTNAKIELGWECEKTLQDMCIDAWRWQKNNPCGY